MNLGEIKYEVFTHYSNTLFPSCVKCGFTNIKALCLDHINSDGNVHRKGNSKKTGINLYRYLLKNNFKCEFELQTLCSNCNMIKFFDKKESSHIKTEEWKNNISKALKKVIQPKGVKSHRAKKVLQFTLDGEFVKEWEIIKEAEFYYNKNKNAKNIVACCNNRQHTAYGFIWKHLIKGE